MSKEREALRLALEALEKAPMGYHMESDIRCYKAISAIKEALAQPEQEPVTWGVDWGRAGQTPCVSIIKRLNDGRIEVVAVEYGPQRTWVGLTDEEFEKMLNDAGFTRSDLLMIGVCVEQIVELVQAKLKEKNI